MRPPVRSHDGRGAGVTPRATAVRGPNLDDVDLSRASVRGGFKIARVPLAVHRGTAQVTRAAHRSLRDQGAAPPSPREHRCAQSPNKPHKPLWPPWSSKRERSTRPSTAGSSMSWGGRASRRWRRPPFWFAASPGTGAELAKNVILAGVKAVTLYDPTSVTHRDLGGNPYARNEDVGKPRADCCAPRLAELNPYVTVSVMKNGLRGRGHGVFALVRRGRVERARARV